MSGVDFSDVLGCIFTDEGWDPPAPACPDCGCEMTLDEGYPMQTGGPSSAWEPGEDPAWYCEDCGTEIKANTEEKGPCATK